MPASCPENALPFPAATISGFLFARMLRFPAAEVMSKLLCLSSQAPHLGLRHLSRLSSDSSHAHVLSSSQTSQATRAQLGCSLGHTLEVPASQPLFTPPPVPRPLLRSSQHLKLNPSFKTSSLEPSLLAPTHRSLADILELIASSTPSTWQLPCNIS